VFHSWLDAQVTKAIDNFERRNGWRRPRLNYPRPHDPPELWPVEQPLENYYKTNPTQEEQP
jgi:hypothetical protein